MREAVAMGLGVKFRNLGRRNGELHSSGVVFINPCKPDFVQRATLAHEMGHWYHSHDWTREHDNVADERQADMFAARLLISPTEYATAERESSDPRSIALALDVPLRFVVYWQEMHRGAVLLIDSDRDWLLDA